MKKRSLLIFVALALVPLILLAQISGPGSYASVIMTFLRSTTAAAARSAIGAANSGSGGELTNAVIYGSTSGSVTVSSTGQVLASDGTASLPSISWASDPDTGFYKELANRLVLVTAGGNPIYFDSTGIQNRSGAVGSPSYRFGSDGSTGMWLPSSGNLAWSVSSLEKMRLTTSGLGINTTSPEKALDINSSTGAALQLTYNDSNGSAANKVTFDVSSGGDLTVAPSGSDASFTGRLASTPTSSTLAAAATAIAVTANVMTITGDAGANTVATITGGLSGQILTLIFVDSLVTITDDATATSNTVNLSAAFTSTSNDTLTLVFNGTSWREVARSVN